MSRVLICARPGDELALFGNAVLRLTGGDWQAVLACVDPIDLQEPGKAEAEWRAACGELGVAPSIVLGFPDLPHGTYPLEHLASALAPCLRGRARVYVPDIEDATPLRAALTAAAALVSDCLWMEAATGVGEVCALDTSAWERVIAIANRNYPARLRVGRPSIRDLRGVRQYRQVTSSQITRFAKEALSWTLAEASEHDPWDLESSPYEAARFALELSVLRELPWESLVEVGAGVGTFTARLREAFPQRRICAYEPSPRFVAQLKQRLAGKVEIVSGGAEEVRGHFDAVYVSSILYYLDRFPLAVLDAARSWLVVSHRRSYHDDTLGPILASAGWMRQCRRELPPVIEPFCGIPVLKDGTEVAVWSREDARSTGPQLDKPR